MILIDTSVWIDHFRRPNRAMMELLSGDEVVCHPFVIGELACGYLPDRIEILALLQELPSAPSIDHDSVLAFVDRNRLMGTGIGWVDAHLLASSLILGCGIWSVDRPLTAAAHKLGVAIIR